MPKFHLLQCPVESCEYHFKIINGPVSALQDHIYREHDYQEKLDTAIKHSLITISSPNRSPAWLSLQLAKEGIVID